MPTREQKKQKDLAKKQENCGHSQWSKRCGLCSMVLESDTQTNVAVGPRKIEVSGYQIKVEEYGENYSTGIVRLFELERRLTLLLGKAIIQISKTPFSKTGRYLTVTLLKGDTIKIKRDFYYGLQIVDKTQILMVDTL